MTYNNEEIKNNLIALKNIERDLTKKRSDRLGEKRQ